MSEQKYIEGAPEFMENCECPDCIFQKKYFADTPEGTVLRNDPDEQKRVWAEAIASRR